ncbi:MAG: hypothetical protein ACTJLL_01750 [Anaplasma sp.]
MEAVVDGKVITSLDVSKRLVANTFFYKTTHAGSSKGEVLQSLIDESVLELEAAELGLSVDKQELEAEASRLFSVLGVCGGLSIEECASQNELDTQSVEAHIRSRVIWGKMLSARVVPFLAVSDSDVADYIAETKSDSLETVLDLEQVFVPFKAGHVLDAVLSEINKGVELEKISARYREHAIYADHTVGAVASAFVADVRTALMKAKVGEVVGPIKIDRGYLVLKLLGKVKVGKRFLNSLASLKRLSVAQADAENVMRDIKVRGATCDTLESIVKSIGLEAASLEVRVGDLASKLQSVLKDAKPGEVLSSPAKDGDAMVDLIMLCGTTQRGQELTEEEVHRIKQAVYADKLVSASSKLMESIRGRHFTEKF